MHATTRENERGTFFFTHHPKVCETCPEKFRLLPPIPLCVAVVVVVVLLLLLLPIEMTLHPLLRS